MLLEKKLNKLNFDTPFETLPPDFIIIRYCSFMAGLALI